MKPTFIIKMLFSVCFLGAFNVSNAQVHPLAFGPHTLAGSTTMSDPMWYKNYVGARVAVTNPSTAVKDLTYTIANDGLGGTGQWGGYIDSIGTGGYNMIDVPVVMCSTDSEGCSIPAGSMTGKIALIWRGNCQFACKALQAQNAGARAIVIMNQHPGEGPVGMGMGTVCTGTFLIPIIMIGNLDGLALTAIYHTSAPGTVKMSITPWGQGLRSDLGFVPNGVANWHAYAIPASQFAAGGNSSNAYRAMDGAFIANFGSRTASNVKLISTLSFTPTGGSPTVQHRDTITYAGPFVGVYSSLADTIGDSVMAMFDGNEYTLTGSGPGRFDLNYSISYDSVDQFLGDNNFTSTFYLSDSVYSKGRYDFTNKRPYRNLYEAFGNHTEYVWGPLYYVAKGGSYLSKVQYSLSEANDGTVSPYFLTDHNDLLIFKWVDGANGQPNDSLMQDGELELLAISTKTFNTSTDSSGADLTIDKFYDPNNPTLLIPNFTFDANTWYYIGIDVTSTANQQYLGCDGILNPLPRIYGCGLANFRNLDYSSKVMGSAADTASFPGANSSPMPATQTSFVYVFDSFNFHSTKGLIPSVAVVMRGTFDSSHIHDAVNNTTVPKDKVTLFPNPASDNMSVNVELAEMANTITYKIFDGLGRFVGKETHTNVRNETYSVNTALLHSGHYFMMISADGKNIAVKKFTIVR